MIRKNVVVVYVDKLYCNNTYGRYGALHYVERVVNDGPRTENEVEAFLNYTTTVL
jgi:hypothetical protein